ncbi:MAG TPA: PAS domain S-box protein [Leptolyngbyaceae cyanobacterium M33_DOE_097]|nr:PAS domain S-box protein [Leptolyngbyaceae cyanobacterium M33_DOE_097]
MLGYSEAELSNDIDVWLSYFHPEDRQAVLEMTDAYVNGERADWAIEHRVFHKDGSIRWLMARGTAIQDQEETFLRLIGTTTDITELKLTEQALRRSNAMLKVQQDAAIDGILITDENQKIVSYNQRFYHIWRIPENIISNTYDDYQLRQTVLDQLKEPENFLKKIDYLNQHPEMISQDEILCKDGRIFDRYSAAIKSFEGDNFGRIWYFRDITEIKQAEAALRQNEQKFLQLTENIRDVFFIMAPDCSQVFYISPAYEVIWGRSCVSLYESPKSWIEAIHPDDQLNLLPALKALLKPEEQSLEYRIVQLTGEIRWVLTRTFPIFDDMGRVHRIAGIVRDITELKQIEAELKQYQDQLEALVIERTKELNAINQQLQQELRQREQTEATLRESERRWRTLMDDVRLLVVGLDTQMTITYANPFLTEVTGYSQAELVGKNWLDVFSPSQSGQAPHQSDFLVKSFRVHHQEALLTKVGEIREIAWNCTLLRSANGDIIGFLSIGEDITERALIERMKDEFISVVSHEFRTPLTAIHGAVDLISDGLVDLQSDRARQLLEIASEGTERLVYLVDNILDLERLESGKVELVKRSCDIGELMLRAVDLMQFSAEHSNVELLTFPISLNLQIDGDLILQVLTNLLSNAIKFSSPGSTVWLNAELRGAESLKSEQGSSLSSYLSACPSHTVYVLLSIKDQGRGIPFDKIETIFERFQQVDVSDSRQKGGTGLGLAICRNIVQQHGGHIWVESMLGAGSCFYVLLPASE